MFCCLATRRMLDCIFVDIFGIRAVKDTISDFERINLQPAFGGMNT